MEHEEKRNELLAQLDDTQENEFYKMLSEQFTDKKENLEFITELSDRDIMIITRLWVLDDWAEHKVDLIPMIIKKFISMRVSLRRQGRKELFESFKSQFNLYENPLRQEGMGGMRSWFGSRR